MYGTRPFVTEDKSRNNWAVALVSLGEGWHHNHHAFPTSARHGLRGIQVDPSFAVIKGLEKLGLASNVKTPSSSEMERKRPGAEAGAEKRFSAPSREDLAAAAAESGGARGGARAGSSAAADERDKIPA